MMTMPPVLLDVARANSILGTVLNLSENMDRLPADRRPIAIACPTCDEGIRTITHPMRCAECAAEARIDR